MSKFKKLVVKLKKKGVKNPDALAAWIGRRKYGFHNFENMAMRGKRVHRKI